MTIDRTLFRRYVGKLTADLGGCSDRDGDFEKYGHVDMANEVDMQWIIDQQVIPRFERATRRERDEAKYAFMWQLTFDPIELSRSWESRLPVFDLNDQQSIRLQELIWERFWPGESWELPGKADDYRMATDEEYEALYYQEHPKPSTAE